MTVYHNENHLDDSNVLYAQGRLIRYDKVDAPIGADIHLAVAVPI